MRKRKYFWSLFVVLALAAVHGSMLHAKTEEPTAKTVRKAADGQTILDVSQGSIVISSTGATGGGYSQ